MHKSIFLLFISLFAFIGCSNSITYPDISQISDGDEYNLTGRSLASPLPKPKSDIPVEYLVLVKIKVDRNGYVVGAEYSQEGSTTKDSRLISAAIGAATKAKFNKNPDSPAFVYGTITYHFAVDRVRMEDEEEHERKEEEERWKQEELERQKRSNSNTLELDNRDYGFQLTGRSLLGSLPKPNYDEKEEGIVVVKIKVDRNGYMVGAEYSLKGSTTQDSRLINAAIKAAKRARFNKDPEAPAFVYGTITYHFVLD